jgi:hypothetical protein
MTAVLGDVCGDRGQFRHLMAARCSDGMARVQAARAAAARVRRQIHNRVHAFDGDQVTMASWMPWLPPGFALTLRATPTRPLLTRQAIGGWWLRGNRRILLLQGELTFEIGNPLRLLLELFAKPLIFLLQLLDLLRLAIVRVARCVVASRSLLPPSRHRRERTKSPQKVQVQNRAKCQRA